MKKVSRQEERIDELVDKLRSLKHVSEPIGAAE